MIYGYEQRRLMYQQIFAGMLMQGTSQSKFERAILVRREPPPNLLELICSGLWSG